MKDILFLGCSFTRYQKGFDYPDRINEFLKTKHNIRNFAKSGSGIAYQTLGYETYKKKFGTDNLAHLVFQVPCPSRQPMDLQENNVGKWWFKDKDSVQYQSATSLKKLFELAENKQQYHQKALYYINEIVTGVQRETGASVTLFVYVKRAGYTYEINQSFYEEVLKNYAEQKGLNYINEDMFDSEYFRRNALVIDRAHTNETGARLIAEAIAQEIGA